MMFVVFFCCSMLLDVMMFTFFIYGFLDFSFFLVKDYMVFLTSRCFFVADYDVMMLSCTFLDLFSLDYMVFLTFLFFFVLYVIV